MFKFLSKLFGITRKPHPANPSQSRTRPELEALEDRFVPAVINLQGHTFQWGEATASLTILSEKTNGAFIGYFQDFATGLSVYVQGALSNSGKHSPGVGLVPAGAPIDNIWFTGLGKTPLGLEQVQFKGQVAGWGDPGKGYANTHPNPNTTNYDLLQGSGFESPVGSILGGGYYANFSFSGYDHPY
jgi:hypothetical protein